MQYTTAVTQDCLSHAVYKDFPCNFHEQVFTCYKTEHTYKNTTDL